MKFNKKLLEKKWAAYTIATCSAVLLYMALMHIGTFFRFLGIVWDYIAPIITGLAIAVILDPVMRFFENRAFGKLKHKKIARGLSVLCTMLFVLLLVILLSVALVPQLTESISTLIGNWDNYADSLMKSFENVSRAAMNLHLSFPQITKLGENLAEKITTAIPSSVGNIVDTSYSIGKGFFNAIVGFILAAYFLTDKERIKRSMKRFCKALLSDRLYDEGTEFFRQCYSIIIRYVGSDLLDGLIIAIINFIFMTIIGLPYQSLISFIVGVTNLAPTFGPIIGGILGAFILLLVNPWYALWFILFTIVLQTLDGYVIKPKLFGNTFGVPPMWILIMIVLGGRIFGFWGIMLAIPVTAIISYLYDNFIRVKIDRKNEAKDEKRRQMKEKINEDSV